MDKKDVLYIYMYIYITHIKNETMPFVEKWMELEIVILN